MTRVELVSMILRGTVPVSAPTIPEPWFVVDPAANVRRTPDGRIFRMAPGPEDPHHPYSVARRAMAGPFLLIAIPFHGEGLLVQALPIEGSDVLVGRERLAMIDVARLAGGTP